MKRLSFFLLLATMLGFIWLGNEQRSFEQSARFTQTTIPEVGFQAPHFELMTAEGEAFAFPEETKGEVVFLNFWASWCPPCRAETPDMVEVSNLYEGNVTFIGINTAYQDRLEPALEFMKQYEVPYLNVFDNEGHVSKRYQISATPTSFVIDKNGTIIYRKLGGMTRQEMIYAIEKGLGGSE